MGIKIAGGSKAIKTQAGKYDQHLGMKKAEAVVTVEKKVNGETIHKGEEHIPIHEAKAGDCFMEVAGGRTLCPKQFESVRIDVRLGMPCAKEEIEQTYEFLTSWISEKISEASEQLGG